MAGRQDVDNTGLDYVVKVPYNGTGMTGGDPLTENLNIWYEACVALSLSSPDAKNSEARGAASLIGASTNCHRPVTSRGR